MKLAAALIIVLPRLLSIIVLFSDIFLYTPNKPSLLTLKFISLSFEKSIEKLALY